MKVLTITNVLEYSNYVLTDGEKEYRLIIYFYNTEKPKVNDKLLLHKNLLTSITTPFSFKAAKDVDAESIKELELEEYAILKQNKKYITLKQIYG